jgi:hypothetical protein
MLTDTALWTALLLGAVAYGAMWAFPQTRPYAKKFWWVAVIFLVSMAGIILARGSLGRREDIDDAKREGEDIQKETQGQMDALVDKAREEMARVDAELAVARIESEQERAETQAKLDAVAAIDDSLERRKALIAISKGA